MGLLWCGFLMCMITLPHAHASFTAAAAGALFAGQGCGEAGRAAGEHAVQPPARLHVPPPHQPPAAAAAAAANPGAARPQRWQRSGWQLAMLNLPASQTMLMAGPLCNHHATQQAIVHCCHWQTQPVLITWLELALLELSSCYWYVGGGVSQCVNRPKEWGIELAWQPIA